MVSSPSAVRQISVAWNEIITVSFADVEVLENGRLGDSVVVDETQVRVSDLVVIVGWSGANLKTSDKNVSKFSGIVFTLHSSSESFDIFVSLEIEACVPLTVLGGELDFGRHGKMDSDLPASSRVFKPKARQGDEYPKPIRYLELEVPLTKYLELEVPLRRYLEVELKFNNLIGDESSTFYVLPAKVNHEQKAFINLPPW